MVHELKKLERTDGVSGRLSGHLFENGNTGVERGLYWDVTIDYPPISYIGEIWEPAIHFGWLRIGSLKETTFTSISQPDAEASFYIVSYDPADSWTLQIEHDDSGLPILARYELSIDFMGLNDDPMPNMKIVGSSPLEVTFVSVSRDNFVPKPSSHAEARAMIEPFFPQISEWEEVQEEDEEGWPVPDPRSFRFSRAG